LPRRSAPRNDYFLKPFTLIIIKCGGGKGSGGGGVGGGTAEGEITLAWDSETDPAVAGYKIHYGTISKAVSGRYEHSTDDGMATKTSNNTTSYTLRGLTRSQTFGFVSKVRD
jgi:hypothetical protein